MKDLYSAFATFLMEESTITFKTYLQKRFGNNWCQMFAEICSQKPTAIGKEVKKLQEDIARYVQNNRKLSDEFYKRKQKTIQNSNETEA
jgi:hypothetical protein